MENIMVAENVMAKAEKSGSKGKIFEHLYVLQTNMQVKKKNPNGLRYNYYSVDDILQEFHRVQHTVPCALSMNTTIDEIITGRLFVICTARLTSNDDPTDYVEVEGIVECGYGKNLGTLEQQWGATATYARKQALCNLFGLVEEQIDGMEMTPVSSQQETKKPRGKNTVPVAPAPAPAPAPVAQASVPQPAPVAQPTPAVPAPAPVATAKKIFASSDGTGVLKLADTFIKFSIPEEVQTVTPADAGRLSFECSGPLFNEKYKGKKVASVWQEMIQNEDGEAIKEMAKLSAGFVNLSDNKQKAAVAAFSIHVADKLGKTWEWASRK